jgi:glycosyltransferase involved in cell wall biosynthesis
MGDRPRILFVVNVDSFFVSHRLHLGLACRARGWDVAVCAAPAGAADAIEAHGMRLVPLNLQRGSMNPLAEARTALDLVRVYQRERPDIVHHVTIKPVIYGSIAAKVARVPCVVNAISGLGYVFIPRAEDKLRHRGLRRALWAAYTTALSGSNTRVIFQNEDDRGAFVDRGIVAGDRTRLIRGSGVDLDLFQASELPSDGFVAVLPARLLFDKGIAEFVTAARLLKKRHPAARFVLVGPLDEHNPARIPGHTVEAWKREGIVEWWGAVPRERMPAIYAAAHVVVLPSYREGLPLALAEAAASGRACIATDVPGCRAAVQVGRTGWLVPARDANALASVLEECLLSRAELTRRGREAADFAREAFALPAVIAATLAIYDELLAAR